MGLCDAMWVHTLVYGTVRAHVFTQLTIYHVPMDTVEAQVSSTQISQTTKGMVAGFPRPLVTLSRLYPAYLRVKPRQRYDE